MQDLENDLKTEVLARSLSATLSFAAIALTICWSDHFPLLAKQIALAIGGVNIWRATAYFIWRKRKQEGLGSAWYHFFWASMLNGALWGFLLLTTTLSSYHTKWTISLVLLLTVAIVVASVFTLGYAKKLHIAFVAFVSTPTIASLLVAYSNTSDTFYINSSIILIIGTVYVLSQARLYRKRFEEKIKADRDLLNSQAALLEQRAMTEHANRLTSIGELAAGFAHEINNPLAIISGNLKLAEQLLAKQGSLDPQIEKLLTRSIAATSRISKIIQGLRTLSRRSSNDGHSSHSLYSIVQETLGMFEERFYQLKIDFKLVCDDEIELLCDRIQISQIVLNMLNNACDVLAELSEPSERWIQVLIIKNEQQAVVEFTNGGPPIDKDIRSKLFTPFFTTKPVGQGMGLGLSISRSIAIQHEGDLSVLLKDERTCFRLTLPLAPAANTEGL